MKLKDNVITTILCISVILLYIVVSMYNKIDNNKITKLYNVYLNGDVIGAINDKEALYALIDEKQQEIKKRYNVSNVYPPNSLKVVENYSYTTKTNNLEDIYNKIEEIQDFTIHGYEVEVSKTEDHDGFKFYILNKSILNDALKSFVLAFISEEDYNNYLIGNVLASDDIGITYQNMSFIEDITIREKYISVNDKIYESSEELAQELLFGFNYKERSYTIKEGDTIESISEDNKLNTQEFLIANPRYSSKDSLLAIGDQVNITLIDPELSFSYDVREVKKVEIDFQNEIVRDNSKDPDYSEITRPGVKGLEIQTTKYNVVNGEQNSELAFESDPVVIREKVDQITTKGKQVSVWGWENIQDTGAGWRWPTENPFAITSEFAWRWGRQHNGLDISGSGWGSRIYAANDGTVVRVVTGCSDNGYYGSSCGGGYGNHVVINHGGNIYTLYGHMLGRIPVTEGQSVSRGTVVGYMGNSGSSQGTHLHFGLSIGFPGQGQYRNPRELYPN